MFVIYNFQLTQYLHSTVLVTSSFEILRNIIVWLLIHMMPHLVSSTQLEWVSGVAVWGSTVHGAVK